MLRLRLKGVSVNKKQITTLGLLVDLRNIKSKQMIFIEIKEKGNFLRIFYKGKATTLCVSIGAEERYLLLIKKILNELGISYPTIKLSNLEQVLQDVLNLHKVEVVNNRKVKTIILIK